MKILVIDDNTAVLETVALLLVREGHTVSTAPDGRQGLARLEAGEAVDLVLTDLDMPNLSGTEVVREVRSRWPHVRVGLMTGRMNHLPSEQEPVDVLLRKPVSLYELREAINRLSRWRP